MRPHWFVIPEVPDVRDHRIRMRSAGSARASIFGAAAQLLRTIARLEPYGAVVTLRGDFDPGRQGGLQNRMRWLLRCDLPEQSSLAVVRSLAADGPLGPFYPLAETAPLGVTDVRTVAEVLRREETLAPLVTPQDNPHVAVVPLYVVLHELKANEDNDWMGLDRLLSRHPHRAAFEVRVAPVDAAPVRQHALKMLADVRAINAFNARESWSAAAFSAGAEAPGPDTSLGKERHLRDPLADEVAREQQRVYERLRAPQVGFSIRVFADLPSEARAIASCIGESAFREGSYDVLVVDADANEAAARWVADALAASRQGDPTVAERDGRPSDSTTWKKYARSFMADARSIARVASVDELAGLFRLPVAGELAPSTFRKNTDPLPRGADERTIVLGIDQDIGLDAAVPRGRRGPRELVEQAAAVAPLVELPINALCKHMFVCGVPGSGKTTAMLNLIAQLWSHGIPTLVLETAKTEYRVLKTLTDHPDDAIRRLAQDLRVYTPGDDGLSPLRFNPFDYDRETIGRDEHIDNLMACFRGGLPNVEGYIEAILTDAVERVYLEGDAGGYTPRMTDLSQAARVVAEEKGYAGDTASNTRAVLDVRMGMLTSRSVGRIFAQRSSVPSVAELMRYPTVIEFEHAGPRTAGLLTLFLLSALREHIKTDRTREPNGDLAHVIIVEEAHNLVARPRAYGDSSNNTASEAAGFVTRMLAEMRALGEGIIIADQLPTAVAPEVIRHTGTKMAARLVSRDDREEIGSAMLLDGSQVEELARLNPGEAYVYTDGFHVPRRTKALDAADYLGLRGRYPAGASLIDHLGKNEWVRSVLLADLTSLEDRDDAWRSRLRRSRDGIVEYASARVDAVLALLRDEPAAVDVARDGLGGLERVLLDPIVAAQKEIDALRKDATSLRARAVALGVPGGCESLTARFTEASVARDVDDYASVVAPWMDKMRQIQEQI